MWGIVQARSGSTVTVDYSVWHWFLRRWMASNTQTDVLMVDKDPIQCTTPKVHRITTSPSQPIRRPDPKYMPVNRALHTGSELWMVQLGSPGESLLEMLPGNVTGVLSTFQFHPFKYVDFKEQAHIQKQAAQRMAERTTETRR
jgi:hypothetical protein